MYRHFLIPTDGSALSDEAVRNGVAFAADIGAKVTFLMVTEPFHVFTFEAEQLEDTKETYGRHMRQRARRVLQSALHVAEARGVECNSSHVEDDEPFRAIVRVARQEQCDLIAMASHGRRGVQALVIGSETLKVLTHSTIPVLVYRSSAGLSLDEHDQHASVAKRERLSTGVATPAR